MPKIAQNHSKMLSVKYFEYIYKIANHMKANIKLANQSGTGDYRQCLPFSVEYGSNVSECVRSMGVPSETTAGSDFFFSVVAEMLVRRVCSLSTHIPS